MFVIGIVGVVIVGLLVAAVLSLSAADRKLLFSAKQTYNGRTYSVVVPKHITPQTKIILGLDGFGGNGKRFGYYTGLHNADTEAVVIYPDPLPPTRRGEQGGWNAGFCCGTGWVHKTDDVAFLTELVRRVAGRLEMTEARVFAAGFSNGAFMVQRLAIEQPQLLSAVAIVSGSLGTRSNYLKPSRPLPILLVHGAKDAVVPFKGGTGRTGDEFDWQPFDVMRAAWQRANQGKAKVITKIYPDFGHGWKGWRRLNVWHKEPSQSQEIIAFFNECR